jgi:hypothetical protein
MVRAARHHAPSKNPKSVPIMTLAVMIGTLTPRTAGGRPGG